MRKLTYEYIKDAFEKEEYKLLSKEYINNRQKLYYECSNGHVHKICWSDWSGNRRCPICSEEKRVDKRRLNIEFISKSFSDEEFVLLTNNYINVDQKLEFICPKGHKYFISWHNWKSGWRCAYCHHEKLSTMFVGNNHPNWKGGISCEPYCDAWADKEFKRDILKRDEHKCQNSSCYRTNSALCIHHIDYNKKNCHPKNLITLCKSCNSRANYSRKWHNSFYESIIKKKYNYKEV